MYETIAGDIEEVLIGSILIESARGRDEAIRKVEQILTPYDFTNPNCRKYFRYMRECLYPPDQIILCHAMNENNECDLKDPSILTGYIELVPCSLEYLDYAKCIREHSLKRQAQELAKRGDFQGLKKLTENKPLGIVPL